MLMEEILLGCRSRPHRRAHRRGWCGACPARHDLPPRHAHGNRHSHGVPFTAIIKVFGFFQHVRQGSVHWRTTFDVLIGSVLGTVAGIFVISSLVERFGDAFNDWLKVVIGLVLIAAVGASYLARRQRGVGFDEDLEAGRNWKGLAAGLLCGIIIGGTSVGGGSLLIVIMLRYYRITPTQIVGSSIAVSLVLMIIGTAGYWRGGLSDLTVAWHLTIGGIPTVILGSMMTLHVSPILLARVVALAIVVAGISLAVQGGISLAGG